MTVLSILFGILLPALLQVHEAAQRAHCLNNLRQIGHGHLEYVQANKDWVISAYARNRVGSWLNYFYADLFDCQEDILFCPRIPPEARFNPPGGKDRYDVSVGTSYLMNACNAGAGSTGWQGSTLPHKNSTYGWTTGFTGHARYARPLRYTRVRQRTNRILVSESTRQFVGLSVLSKANAGRYVDRYKQTDHGPPMMGSGYAAVRNIGEHHNGRFNVLMGGLNAKTLLSSEDEQWAAYVAR